MSDHQDMAQKVATRYLQARMRKRRKPKSPFEYERPGVPEIDQAALSTTFKDLPWWGGPKKDAPDPERAEEEYAEESSFTSPEYSPGARGYKGQFKAFREKFKDTYLPNPMPKGSYKGWQPKVQVDTLISWTDGGGSSNPRIEHHMQAVSSRIIRTMYQTFRRSQTTR